jgi:hypothetical protein
MRLDLRSRLALVVSFAGAAACGTGFLEGDCPHTVVERSFVLELSSDEACALAPETAPWGSALKTDASVCRAACKDSSVDTCFFADWYACSPTSADAGACPALPEGRTSVPFTCQVTHSAGTDHSGCPVNGRRPDGLAPARRRKSASRASPLGNYFASCAHLEAASVIAFRSMRRELAAHGAPARLTRAAARAEREEIRHTEMTRALTRRFGGAFEVPRVRRRRVRSIVAIALENAVEGVVRETYGAAQALFGATHARDLEVRCAMREIAEDECRHAALSWALAAWADKQLDMRARRRIDRAMATAIAELRREAQREPAPELRELAGVPSSAEARRLIDGLVREVWTHTPA